MHPTSFEAAGATSEGENQAAADPAPRERPVRLGGLLRRAQTGNVQTYLTVLLAGSLVLAVAAVLAATGNGGA